MSRPLAYNLKPKAGRLFFVLFLAASCWSLAGTSHVAAQTQPTEYELLAPLPLDGVQGGETQKTTADKYISGMFQLVIALAGVLAVIMIVVGGIQYMSTDAFTGRSDAKDRISNAMWGLLLVIGAWLILYTVNPKLVEFNFNFPGATTPTAPSAGGGGTALPGYPLTPEQVAQDTAIRNNLAANNPAVRVTNDPCVTGGTQGCTNVVGLPTNAIDGVKNFAINCRAVVGGNCAVSITGGTEGGHVTHGPNLPVMDLRKNTAVDSYITARGSLISPPSPACSRLGPQYRLSGATYVDEGDHWHVCY